MRRLVGFALAAAAIMSIPVGAYATAYTVASSGNWGDPARWTPVGFPDSAEDTASAPSAVSAAMTLADVNTNDASFTVKSVSASAKGSINFAVNNVSGGTGKLIFDNPTGDATINTVKNSGKYCDFNVGIVLNTNLSVKSLSAVGAKFTKEISSGVGRTTGLIIASQTGNSSAQNPVDVLINAAASYTGETRVMGSALTPASTVATDGGGKLLLGLNNALPITTVLRIDGATTALNAKGGTLKLNGKNQEVAGLYGAAGYDPGKITTTTAATLTINNAADYDFAGSIGGATPTPVSVTKKGIGVQALSGTNTYTGATTVEAGTLALAETGELRFVIQNGNVANRVIGDGAVDLNGLLRLDVSALTDTESEGTWNLVNAATLTASFGSSFGVAFEGGPTFINGGDGVYTSTGGWEFTTANGTLTLTPPVLATLITVR